MPDPTPAPAHDCALHPHSICRNQAAQMIEGAIQGERLRLGGIVRGLAGQATGMYRSMKPHLEALAQILEGSHGT